MEFETSVKSFKTHLKTLDFLVKCCEQVLSRLELIVEGKTIKFNDFIHGIHGRLLTIEFMDFSRLSTMKFMIDYRLWNS